jgi:hypothetical protein
MGDHVLVRDSKDPEPRHVRLDPAAWQAFLAGVRRGEFDRPQ